MVIYAYFWFIFNRQTQGSVLDLPLSQQEQIWHLNEFIRVWLLSLGCMDQYHIEYMHPEQHPHLLAILLIQYLYSIFYLAIHKLST